MQRIVSMIVALAALAGAQQPAGGRPSAEEAWRAKLASPFLESADWLLDYEDALAAATAEQKLVFAYFTTANH